MKIEFKLKIKFINDLQDTVYCAGLRNMSLFTNCKHILQRIRMNKSLLKVPQPC